MLSEVAQLLNITIIGGSIPERSGDKLYNTCCVYGPDGKLKAKHRKVISSVRFSTGKKLYVLFVQAWRSFSFSNVYSKSFLKMMQNQAPILNTQKDHMIMSKVINLLQLVKRNVP